MSPKEKQGFEFPYAQQLAQRKARTLEWVTVMYLIAACAVMYFALGTSQAMKAAWVEDLLSLIPPIIWLLASPIAHRAPTTFYPYGYHRATSLAFLGASLALFSVGGFIFVDSAYKVTREHSSIGLIQVFGVTVWHGWVMIAALLFGTVPAIFLGRAKLPLASIMHDKVLHADASMNKAD